ncbi:MAG: SDR family oxidoreductase, partial [Planctomycetota bacterium]
PIPIGTWVVVRGEVTGFDEELSRMKIHTTVRGRDDDALLVEGEAEVILRPPPPEPEPTETVDERGCGPLDRRRVLVVGGSRGIGAAICDELIAQGADLSVSYCRNESAARAIGDRAAAAGRRGLAVPLVLEEEASIASAVERSVDALQGLDALVFCGFGEIVQRGLERGTFEQLEDAFRRAVGGLYHCSRAALPALRQSDDGAIVALSSTVTLEVPPPCWTAYNVAKSALVGLARSLAVELGPDGVRVNLVSPSLTETEKNVGLPPRILDEFRSRSVLGRLATPRDVARAVAFLASDRASFLTGVDLPVAGGAVM